jgi:acyl-CoA synthetase (AMP-forming)/AMP-acid ligase II
MGDILAAHAAAQPDKPAVIDDRPGREVVTWTFDELNRRVNQLSHLLVERGVAPGTKVVWAGQNSAWLVAAMHACRKVGAVSVPLNYRLSPEEATYVVDNSDATVVWVDAAYASLIEAIRPDTPKVTEVLVFDGDGAVEAQLAAQPDTEPEVGELPPSFTMIYTSGTTGKPKGALRGGATDPAGVTGLLSLIGYVGDDVYLTTGPLYHSGPGGFAAIAHVLGNTVVVQHKFDAEDWLRLVETYSVTTTFTAPTPIRMICTLPDAVKARYDHTSMRRLIANAAPWTLALKKQYLANFPVDSLYEVYGSSELGVDTVLLPDEHLRKPGSCGRPAPGVEIRLFDEHGGEVTEPLAHGEVFVRPVSEFAAYYKADEKYEADRRGLYHTVGDIGYFDDEGYLYIADRKKDMIISGGMNIYPAEIEAALDADPDVYEVTVFGIPDEEWGERVHAVVVPARPEVSEADIMGYARQHLAGYKVPRSVGFVDELPKTGSGKVLKRELRAPFWAGRTAAV